MGLLRLVAAIYDMERGLLERTLGSELEGFGEQRDLVAQLAVSGSHCCSSSLLRTKLRAVKTSSRTDERRSEQEKAARSNGKPFDC